MWMEGTLCGGGLTVAVAAHEADPTRFAIETD